MQNWDIVIGIETHVQLKTKSKIFSAASTDFGAAPNSQANYIDLALPGTLPVINEKVIEFAIRFGLAIDAHIDEQNIFARKNYFYPDLPKGYQISQFAHPIVGKGKIDILLADKTSKTIRITRAHLEEDAGKSVHDEFIQYTGVDLNRAGTPLLEIVTEPDLSNSSEAVAYAKALHTLVTWIDICDGNMQEGSFRCDANVSIKPKGSEKLGTRCEIKNLNSFRFLQEAIDFEVKRQIEILEDGGLIKQETRLYDANKKETRSMRSKEDAQDYRYFPDPDLLPIKISLDMIANERCKMPELPKNMQNKLISEFNLSEYDALFITQSYNMAEYFNQGISLNIKPKLLANWLMGEISTALNNENLDIKDCPISTTILAQIIQKIEDGTITHKSAKEIFYTLWHDNSLNIDKIIQDKGLKQVSDDSFIIPIIQEILKVNAKMVEEYKSGKEKAFNGLVGQIMKATAGKANPTQINILLKQYLNKI